MGVVELYLCGCESKPPRGRPLTRHALRCLLHEAKTALDEGIDRGLYAFETEGFTIAGQTAEGRVGLHLDGTSEVDIVNGDAPTQFLLLEGRPINEPVAQQGPFVMNHHGELRQAMLDFQTTRFGGWPWPTNDFAHPRDAGRFARHEDGTVEKPGE